MNEPNEAGRDWAAGMNRSNASPGVTAWRP